MFWTLDSSLLCSWLASSTCFSFILQVQLLSFIILEAEIQSGQNRLIWHLNAGKLIVPLDAGGGREMMLSAREALVEGSNGEGLHPDWGGGGVEVGRENWQDERRGRERSWWLIGEIGEGGELWSDEIKWWERWSERVSGKLVGDSVSMLKVIVLQTELSLSFVSDLSSALPSWKLLSLTILKEMKQTQLNVLVSLLFHGSNNTWLCGLHFPYNVVLYRPLILLYFIVFWGKIKTDRER